jgi:hypothetical protein
MIVVIWGLGLFGGGVPAASGGGALSHYINMTMPVQSVHANKITLEQIRRLIRILQKTTANNSRELYKIAGYIAIESLHCTVNQHYTSLFDYSEHWLTISQTLAKLKVRDIMDGELGGIKMPLSAEDVIKIPLSAEDIQKYIEELKGEVSLQDITSSQVAKIQVTDDQVKQVLESKRITLPSVESINSNSNNSQAIITLIASILKYLQSPSDEVTDFVGPKLTGFDVPEVKSDRLTPDTPLTYNPTAPLTFKGFNNLGAFISDGACKLIDPKTNTNRFKCKVEGSNPDDYFLIRWKIDNGWIVPGEIETKDGSNGPIELANYCATKDSVTTFIKSLTYLCSELNSGKKIIEVHSKTEENVVTRMMKIIKDQGGAYKLLDHINDMVKFVKLIVNCVCRDDDTHRGSEQDITSEVLRKYLLSVEPEKKSADPEKPEKQLTLTLEGVAEIQNELEKELQQEMTDRGAIRGELEQKLQQGMTRQRIIEGMIQKKLEQKLKQEMTLERIIQKFKKCTYYYYIKAKLNEQDVTIKRDLKLEDHQGWEIFIKQLTELVCEKEIEYVREEGTEDQGHFEALQFDNPDPGFKDNNLEGFKHLEGFLIDETIMMKSTFTGHEIAQIMKLIYLIAMDGYMRGATVLPSDEYYYSSRGTIGNKGEGFCLDRLMDYDDLLTDTTKLQEIQQTIDFVDVLCTFVKTNFKDIKDEQIIPSLRDGFKYHHKNRDNAIKDAQEVQGGRGIGEGEEEEDPELVGQNASSSDRNAGYPGPNAGYPGQNASSSGQNAGHSDRSTASLQVLPPNNNPSSSGQNASSSDRNAGYPGPNASSSDVDTLTTFQPLSRRTIPA